MESLNKNMLLYKYTQSWEYAIVMIQSMPGAFQSLQATTNRHPP
jgi:hypothetical protein